jgi:O-phospho-L-seryl-tRNASec:L-selenocysteinyl-tRNA synthase
MCYVFIHDVLRVVSGDTAKQVDGYAFAGWGSHVDAYCIDGVLTPYLTAAAALGCTKQQVDLFIQRLDNVLTEWNKH